MITHAERMHTCLNGGKPDRTPVALWRHFPVDDQTPETLAAATINHQSRYDFDIVKITPASSFAVKGWGVEDEWMGDSEGSRRYTRRVIQSPKDWEKLTVLSPRSRYLADQLACVRLVKQGLPAETPIIQTVFNPLSQAKNLAGNDLLLEHLRACPEAVLAGLDIIAKSTALFIEALLEIGIDGIFYAIQHAQKHLLELGEYHSLSLPFDHQAIAPAQNMWCNLLHLHGREIHFSLVHDLNFPMVNWHDRETPPSLAEALSLYPGVVCGGLRQESLTVEDSEFLKKEAADALEQTQGRRFILGTGCVVPVTASHQNYTAARKCVE